MRRLLKHIKISSAKVCYKNTAVKYFPFIVFVLLSGCKYVINITLSCFYAGDERVKADLMRAFFIKAASAEPLFFTFSQ